MATTFENLVFSQLAYQELGNLVSDTIYDLNRVDKPELYKKLSDDTSTVDGSNTKLCSILNNWKVIKVQTGYKGENDIQIDNGFYGVAFRNKSTNEIVISYRGSRSLTEISEDDFQDDNEFSSEDRDKVAIDIVNDWVNTNLMELPLSADKQSEAERVGNATDFASTVIKDNLGSEISLTGHSMGGGLAQRVIVELDNQTSIDLEISEIHCDTFNAPGMLQSLVDPTQNGNETDNIIQNKIINGKYNIDNYVIRGDAVGEMDLYTSIVELTLPNIAAMGLGAVAIFAWKASFITDVAFKASMSKYVMDWLKEKLPDEANSISFIEESDSILELVLTLSDSSQGNARRLELANKGFNWVCEFADNFPKEDALNSLGNTISNTLSNDEYRDQFLKHIGRTHYLNGTHDEHAGNSHGLSNFVPNFINYNEIGGNADVEVKTDDGFDYVVGTNNRDTISTKGGNDYLVGGKGDDILKGGEGNDTYYYSKGDGLDEVKDVGVSANNEDVIILDGYSKNDIIFIKNGLNLKIISRIEEQNLHPTSIIDGSNEIMVIKDWFNSIDIPPLYNNIVEKIKFIKDGNEEVLNTVDLIYKVVTDIDGTEGRDIINVRNKYGRISANGSDDYIVIDRGPLSLDERNSSEKSLLFDTQ